MHRTEKSIVEAVKGMPSIVNKHLDSLNEGHSIQAAPFRYRNIETGEIFVHLAGAIAWPGKEMPGYALVVGVQCREEIDTPFFVCLEEAESRDVGGILTHAVRLQERYGFQSCQYLFRPWYGDHTRFPSLVLQFNQRLQDEHEPEGISITPPIGFVELPNHFEVYLHEIKSLLATSVDGMKKLTLGKCNTLKNALQSLPPDADYRYSDDDCPPVAALGYAVYSVIASEPWNWREDDNPQEPPDPMDFWKGGL